MTKNTWVSVGLLASLLACESDKPLSLVPGDWPQAPEDGARAATSATSLSSYQPLLEGRKYRVQFGDGSGDGTLNTYEIEFDRAPSVDPPVPLPGLGSSSATQEDEIKYSQLVSFACALEIGASSEIIPPSGRVFDLNGSLPNPGTPIQSIIPGPDLEGELHRPKPELLDAYFLAGLELEHGNRGTACTPGPSGYTSTECASGEVCVTDRDGESQHYCRVRCSPGPVCSSAERCVRRYTVPDPMNEFPTPINACIPRTIEPACDPNHYWKQEMELCIARHYLEFAEATTPHVMLLKFAATPLSKTPQTDAQSGTTYPAECEEQGSATDTEEWCTSLTASIEPVSEVNSERRTNDLKAVWDRYRNYDDAAGNSIGLDEPLEEFLNQMNNPLAQWPVQEPDDQATLAQLAINHFQAAIETGAAYIDCVLDNGHPRRTVFPSEGPVEETDLSWVDTYDHRAFPINELVVTNQVDAMREMLEAKELAVEQILAAADQRTGDNPDPREHQLQWRGRINSRLEAIHVLSSLSPRLFQDQDATAEEVKANRELFPVLDPKPTGEVALAVQTLRETRVDPRYVLSASGIGDLSVATSVAIRSRMPYYDSVLSASDREPAAVLQRHGGIATETLRTAAHYVLDEAHVLGHPIHTTNTPIRVETVPNGPSNDTDSLGLFAVSGTAAGQPMHPQVLYARTVGYRDNDLRRGSEIKSDGERAPRVYPFYDGVYGTVVVNGSIFGRLSRNLTFNPASPDHMTPGTFVYDRFFRAPGTRPVHTTSEASTDAKLAVLMQSGLTMAHGEVGGVLVQCPFGAAGSGFYLFSAERQGVVPKLWRNEAGLECALTGQLGDEPCDETEYRVNTNMDPAGWRDARTINPWYEVSGIDFGSLMHIASYYGAGALAGAWLHAAGTGTVALTPGDRIYFTRENTNGGREAFLGLTLDALPAAEGHVRQCIFHPYGEEVTRDLTTIGEPDPDSPDEAKICCEGLPCDLKVPLEDSLQTTPPREVESSFMHYLSLARTAATRADELGDELYRQGLEMDLRAEAARDELEEICGGVQNVEQLTPVSCMNDGECCGSSVMSCPLHCEKFDPAMTAEGRCVAENLADGLAAAERFFCNGDTECGTGRVCVGSGNARYCSEACTADAECGAGEVCLASRGITSQAYCAQVCLARACADGFRCDVVREAEGINPGLAICTPDSMQDLGGLQQCLGVGDDALVGVPLGTEVLCGWREGNKPVCACDSATRSDCPPPFQPNGQPTCPVPGEAGICTQAMFDGVLNGNAGAFFASGRQVVPMDQPLGFTTDREMGAASPTGGVCQDLAQLRTGVGSKPERSALAARILQQPWMQREMFLDFAESLDVDMDLLGFFTILRSGEPWLSTGSEATGPSQSGFPAQPRPPVFPDDGSQQEWDCDDTATSGTALRCQCTGTEAQPDCPGGRLSARYLQRLVNVIQVLAGRGTVTVAGIGTWVQDEDNPGRWRLEDERERVVREWTDETYQGFADPFTVAAPEWLTTGAHPDAVMEIPSATDLTQVGRDRQLEGDDGDVFYQVDFRNAHCYRNLIESELPNNVPSPLCPDDPGDSWNQAYRIKGDVGDSTDNSDDDVIIDTDNLAPLVWDYVTGRNSENGNVGSASSGWTFAPLAERSLTAFLRALAEEDGAMDGDDVAPLLYEGWKLGGEELTVDEALDALELVCIAHSEPAVGARGCPTDLAELPTITSVKDFPQLIDRLECGAQRLDGNLDRMWIPDLPTSIAAAIRDGQVTGTFPTYRGTYNSSISALQGELAAIPISIRTITSQIRDFAGELRQTQWAIEKIENESAILDWRLVADISSQVTACALAGSDTAKNTLSFGASSAIACANSLVQIASLINVHGLQESNLRLEEKQALQGLALNFATRMDTVAEAGDRLNVAYTEIARLVGELDRQRAQATRAAAKMQFLDSDSTGRIYNVNTAMRRRMNTLRVRYQEALKDAKQMTFVARRAIEQRLAVDLEKDDFGELFLVEDPKEWVPDLCSMSGIDYDKIRDSGSSPVGNTKDDNFSEGYIGDYVTKLENFVESYRFNYPFQDGRDVAILSLRDDLKRVTAPCVFDGPNLLYHASNPSLPRLEGEPGWEDLSDAGRSIAFLSAGESPTQPDPDGDAPFFAGGQAVQMSAGSAEPGTPGESAWGQAVNTEEGVYLLSWYEEGACPAPGTGPRLGISLAGLDDPMRVRVFDVAEAPLGDFVRQGEWCRWQLPVEIEIGQNLLIRFSVADGEEVVWAQPQLEHARNVTFPTSTPMLDPPLEFFPTNDVLSASGGACEDVQGDSFRGKWSAGSSFCEPVCAGDTTGCANFDPEDATAFRCYHEITFAIGAGEIENGGFSSQGATATNNFNYRISRFGINLVGTGLRDCEQAPFPTNCYAGGFVQYSLHHDGLYSVTNHTGGIHDVALFPGRIEHAKALAAERMLTNPLAGADRELMGDYWRHELRGRPLQGNYTLRVYDIDGGNGTTVLNFAALEDVQLVVEYNYWTRAE